jgi:PKD repeat protein
MKLLITLVGIFALSAQVNAQCTAAATAAATGNPGEIVISNQSTADPSAVYIIDTGDGNVYTLSFLATSITHQYTAPGAYLWCISIFDSVTPCYDTYCDSIYINTLPTNCDGSFTSIVNPAGPVSFDISGSTSVGTMTHFWDFGDGNTSTAASPVNTYSVNGSYLVCHTVTEVSGNCSDTFCDSVIITGGGGGVFCSAGYFWYQDSSAVQTVNVFNTSTGVGPLTYIWDFGDGTIATGAYPSHTYNALGGYVVCLTITDAAGCSSTYCDSVFITFKMSGFTINVYPESIADIQSVDHDNLSVYPNPASEWLFVESSTTSSGSSIMIYDLKGKLVLSEEMNSQHKKLNISSFDKGIYFLQVDDNMKVKFIKK